MKESVKRPAMPVYVKDIVTDERFLLLSLAGQGLYWRLLCHQWLEGSIPANPRLVERIIGEDISNLWPDVLQFFETNENGRLVNRKLESVRNKQDAFLEGKQEAGRKGAERRWGSDGTPNGTPNGTPIDPLVAKECVAVAVAVPVSVTDSSSKEEHLRAPHARAKYPEAFEVWWKSYPDRAGRPKGSKAKALAKWKRIADTRELDQATRAYAGSKHVAEGYRKDAERFLDGDYWREWLSVTAEPPEDEIRMWMRDALSGCEVRTYAEARRMLIDDMKRRREAN